MMAMTTVMALQTTLSAGTAPPCKMMTVVSCLDAASALGRGPPMILGSGTAAKPSADAPLVAMITMTTTPGDRTTSMEAIVPL